jgi:diguanylate cyclase (GGDEF)-like protein
MERPHNKPRVSPPGNLEQKAAPAPTGTTAPASGAAHAVNSMPHEDIPILVVDDAKFSSAIIAKALRGGGFSNVRFTNNPLQALRSLEKRPAQILIADWLMPSMDGLELSRRVKKLDEANEHFTYVMLLTARDDMEAMNDAFDEGVDDFLNKANLRAQLLPRVVAAQRIASRQNQLLRTNKLLRKKIRELQTTDLVDPVTGLGNLKFTFERINDTIKHAETRGGAACLLLVGINNLDVIQEQYEQAIVDELMSGIGAKVRQLVRPLDVVTRPESNMFAVITLQPDIQNCTSQSFRRIFDNLYMHSFKTSEGYIPVVVGVSISAADTGTGFPHPKHFMRHAYDGLTRSFDTGLITVQPFDPNHRPAT